MTDPSDMIFWMDSKIRSVETWLEDHGRNAKKPWPDHVIESKERDITMFHELRAAYVRALERRESA